MNKIYLKLKENEDVDDDLISQVFDSEKNNDDEFDDMIEYFEIFDDEDD